MRQSLIPFVAVLAASVACRAVGQAPERHEGIYVRYDETGGEHMSAFYPCRINGSWWVENGSGFADLVRSYRSVRTNKYGELFVEVEGRFTPTDRRRFPNEHYDGELSISRVLSYAVDQERIDACRALRPPSEGRRPG